MIFSRRSIQHFIDCISSALSIEALSKLVAQLNGDGLDLLNFEWEVAILHALSQRGLIEYEKDLGGPRRADVSFTLANSTEIDFVADVTGVSDRGLEKENPAEIFATLLRQSAAKLKIDGSFSYRIEGGPEGKKYKDRKVKLALPSAPQIPDLFKKHILPFLRTIKSNAAESATLHINDGPNRISIGHNPSGTYTSGSHPSYKTAYSLTRNPIFTSLKEKAGQLRETKFDGCRGIILCDANCALFKNNLQGGSNFSDRQIIEAFLRNNTSISFVLTLWVSHSAGSFGHPEPLKTNVKLIRNPRAKVPLSDEIAGVLLGIPQLLPTPVNDAFNASHLIQNGTHRTGASLLGGYQMSSTQTTEIIKISSRAILDLLAGRMSPEKFSELHSFTNSPANNGMLNPFESASRKSLLIDAVSIERMTDQDDDWLVFKLSGPDAAVAPFTAPNYK